MPRDVHGSDIPRPEYAARTFWKAAELRDIPHVLANEIVRFHTRLVFSNIVYVLMRFEFAIRANRSWLSRPAPRNEE
ncbi:hypothetical protein GCM10008941_11340 [Rhizomicrobium palustre]